MQSTGQTATHPVSRQSRQSRVMMYAMPSPCAEGNRVGPSARSAPLQPFRFFLTSLTRPGKEAPPTATGARSRGVRGEAGMISLRIVGNEVSALGTAALAMPLRFLLRGQPFDPHAPNPTPVVLVHGFLGDPTNFLALRSHLAARGIRNFVNFSYPPRLDYQRLASRLGQTVEAVCLHTRAAQVDLV